MSGISELPLKPPLMLRRLHEYTSLGCFVQQFLKWLFAHAWRAFERETRCHPECINEPRGVRFFAHFAMAGTRRDKPMGMRPRGCVKQRRSVAKKFFCCCDKYRKSHCNTLQPWITRHSAMP